MRMGYALPSAPAGDAALDGLVRRLEQLTGVPCRIVWEPGLRGRTGLLGWTSANTPTELHIDPDQSIDELRRTVIHEWIHSLEFLLVLPRVRPAGVARCTVLARAYAGPMAAAAAGFEGFGLPDGLLELMVQRDTLPTHYRRTNRGSR